jgi:hypothetical protein
MKTRKKHFYCWSALEAEKQTHTRPEEEQFCCSTEQERYSIGQ